MSPPSAEREPTHFFPFLLQILDVRGLRDTLRESMMRRIVFAAAGLIFAITALAGTTWPQFRGPNGSGIADGDKPPVQFGSGTNQVFKVAVPPGLSSPCIWQDRIFLTALEDGKLVTLCYSAKDGKRLWSQAAPFEKLEGFHPSEGSPAASTPATDGERVYSYFGSAGVFAYSLDGKLLWEHKLPIAEHVGNFGTGTSPIVHGGLVLINRDMVRGSHLLALRASNGEMAWLAERPEFSSSWSTPVILEGNGPAQIVLAGNQRIKGYDLKTGEEKWQFHGLPNAVCPLPVIGDGQLFFAAWSPSSQDVNLGRFASILEKYDKNSDKLITPDEAAGPLSVLFRVFDGNDDNKLDTEEWNSKLDLFNKAVTQAFAIRPGKGEISDENVAWKYTRGLPYVPSSLLYRGKFYMARDGGMVTCLDAKTGKPYYEQERLGALGSYYPSPVAADGRIYICSNDGKFTVIAAGEKPEVLSRAELGVRSFTTPAIAHDKLYIRTADHLWCFGEKK